MLNSRQRAQLRGMANGIETIFQVGKTGVAEQIIKQVNDALEARELIKMRVLETCPVNSRTAADTIASETGADVVQVIGSRFVLFKRNPQEPVIDLKAAK